LNPLYGVTGTGPGPFPYPADANALPALLGSTRPTHARQVKSHGARRREMRDPGLAGPRNRP